jgi:hypothetical protein
MRWSKGVSGGLQPDHTCIGTKSLLVISNTARAYIARLDMIAPHGALEDSVRITVEVIAGNDVIPGAEEAEGSALRRHARSKGQPVFPVFKGSKTLLQHALREVIGASLAYQLQPSSVWTALLVRTAIT